MRRIVMRRVYSNPAFCLYKCCKLTQQFRESSSHKKEPLAEINRQGLRTIRLRALLSLALRLPATRRSSHLHQLEAHCSSHGLQQLSGRSQASPRIFERSLQMSSLDLYFAKLIFHTPHAIAKRRRHRRFCLFAPLRLRLKTCCYGVFRLLFPQRYERRSDALFFRNLLNRKLTRKNTFNNISLLVRSIGCPRSVHSNKGRTR